MKKQWYLCLGLTLGIVATSATPVSAAVDYVKAILFPVKMIVNNEEQIMPEGADILNYNNQTYVPLRFFAEKLGAAVGYQQAQNYEDTRITIDFKKDWTLTALAAPGTHIDSPISLKLNYLEGPGFNDPLQISASIYNVGNDVISLKSPLKIEIGIIETGSNEMVWTGEITSPELTGQETIIPGTDNKIYWGLQSQYIEWDKRDLNGKPVSSGNYALILKEPITINYSLNGSEEVKTQQIKKNNTNIAVGIIVP